MTKEALTAKAQRGNIMNKQIEALKLALETLECWQRNEDCNEPMSKILEAIKEALAQPEQKPLAWISTGTARMIHWTADKPAYNDDWVPLYTTPPQRTWVGLDEEDDLDWEEGGSLKDLVKAIETKLKDKNTSGQE